MNLREYGSSGGRPLATLTMSSASKRGFYMKNTKTDGVVDGYLDDFVGHVFFPRELQLLFIHTGFEIEQTLGNYRGSPLKSDSPLIIMMGRRTES